MPRAWALRWGLRPAVICCSASALVAALWVCGGRARCAGDDPEPADGAQHWRVRGRAQVRADLPCLPFPFLSFGCFPTSSLQHASSVPGGRRARKALMRRAQALTPCRWDEAHAGKDLNVIDGLTVTKMANEGGDYATVLGTLCLASGQHSWSVYINHVEDSNLFIGARGSFRLPFAACALGDRASCVRRSARLTRRGAGRKRRGGDGRLPRCCLRASPPNAPGRDGSPLSRRRDGGRARPQLGPARDEAPDLLPQQRHH